MHWTRPMSSQMLCPVRYWISNTVTLTTCATAMMAPDSTSMRIVERYCHLPLPERLGERLGVGVDGVREQRRHRHAKRQRERERGEAEPHDGSVRRRRVAPAVRHEVDGADERHFIAMND